MNKFRDYSELLKIEHTVFALPFALSSILLLAKDFPPLSKVFWILVALVSGRTLGMALNRLIDEPIDRLNPRTRNWPLPSGRVSRKEVWAIVFLSLGVFFLSCAMIGTLVLLLSPLVVLLLWLYPYSKRFTSFPHLFLGLVYFLIPVGVDVALNSGVSLDALLLGFGMALWVAGFDILYSLQDYEFDKKQGLGSIPVRFGIEKAIKLARAFHVGTLLALLLVGLRHESLGKVYFAGMLLLTLLLVYEHSLVRPGDLSKLGKAFFTVNGYVSVAYLITVALDLLV